LFPCIVIGMGVGLGRAEAGSREGGPHRTAH